MNAVLLKRQVLAMAASLVVASAAQAQGSASSSGATGTGGPSAQMHAQMMKGMQQMQSMQMSGDMDRDFAMMMRDHHKQGIEMARMQIEHGKDPKMREMAKKTMADQQKEVKEFDRWLASNKDGSAKK